MGGEFSSIKTEEDEAQVKKVCVEGNCSILPCVAIPCVEQAWEIQMKDRSIKQTDPSDLQIFGTA